MILACSDDEGANDIGEKRDDKSKKKRAKRVSRLTTRRNKTSLDKL